MKKHLLLLFTALLPLVASAQTKVEIDGIWYNLVSKAKQAEVTFKGDSYDSYWNEYSGSITIPATVTYEGVDYSVTSIGDFAFNDCSNLTAINIPEGVTSIGDFVFNGCSALTAITIPASVTSIGDDAFEGTAWYDNQPNGVVYLDNWLLAYKGEMLQNSSITIEQGTKGIAEGAFAFCGNLTAIDIPSSVTSIGEWAFEHCSLTTVYIPRNVEKVSGNSFYSCNKLSEIIVDPWNYNYRSENNNTIIEQNTGTIVVGCSTIPQFQYIKSIGESAYGGRDFSTIDIPSNIQHIGKGAFQNCHNLTSIVIPGSVDSIEYGAFILCTNLTSVDILEGVVNIGEAAFKFCYKLSSINLPQSVRTIGVHAFFASNITSIVLPCNITEIGATALGACDNLTEIYCYAENPPKATDNIVFSPENITLYVPAGSVAAYKAASYWSVFTNIQPLAKSVTEITLSQTSVTLTEGESITLTATISPDNATDKSITWSSNNTSVATVDANGKVTAIAPGTATITATANDGSGVKASCEVTVNELILGKCATPAISYVDGKILLTCDTEEAIIKSITTEDCAGEREEGVFNITPTYTITAYATKEQYEDSDVATVTLCWIACTEEHEKDDADGILTIPSKPVLIQCQGGVITVSGLADGTEVAVYTTSGTLVATATAEGESTHLTVPTGQVYIVKVADTVVKIGM